MHLLLFAACCTLLLSFNCAATQTTTYQAAVSLVQLQSNLDILRRVAERVNTRKEEIQRLEKLNEMLDKELEPLLEKSIELTRRAEERIEDAKFRIAAIVEALGELEKMKPQKEPNKVPISSIPLIQLDFQLTILARKGVLPSSKIKVAEETSLEDIEKKMRQLTAESEALKQEIEKIQKGTDTASEAINKKIGKIELEIGSNNVKITDLQNPELQAQYLLEDIARFNYK